MIPWLNILGCAVLGLQGSALLVLERESPSKSTVATVFIVAFAVWLVASALAGLYLTIGAMMSTCALCGGNRVVATCASCGGSGAADDTTDCADCNGHGAVAITSPVATAPHSECYACLEDRA